MNRQKLVLFITLVLLALAVTWSFFSFPREKTVASPPAGTVRGKTAEKNPGGTVTGQTPAREDISPVIPRDERTLRLDLLERDQAGFKGYRRNIFKPVFVDEIKVMKQKATAIKPVPAPPVAPVVPRPLVIPAGAPAETAPDTARTALAKFTFLGFLKKDGQKTVFLAKDKEILLVKKGDRFARQYEATAISDQALTIRVTDSGEEIVVPLTENKPLAASLRKK